MVDVGALIGVHVAALIVLIPLWLVERFGLLNLLHLASWGFLMIVAVVGSILYFRFYGLPWWVGACIGVLAGIALILHMVAEE